LFLVSTLFTDENNGAKNNHLDADAQEWPKSGIFIYEKTRIGETRYETSVIQMGNMFTNNANQCGAVMAAEFVEGVAHVVIAIFNFDFFDQQCAIDDVFVVWFEHEMTVSDQGFPFALVSFYISHYVYIKKDKKFGFLNFKPRRHSMDGVG
jgi:hypothetical protein